MARQGKWSDICSGISEAPENIRTPLLDRKLRRQFTTSHWARKKTGRKEVCRQRGRGRGEGVVSTIRSTRKLVSSAGSGMEIHNSSYLVKSPSSTAHLHENCTSVVSNHIIKCILSTIASLEMKQKYWKLDWKSSNKKEMKRWTSTYSVSCISFYLKNSTEYISNAGEDAKHNYTLQIFYLIFSFTDANSEGIVL